MNHFACVTPILNVNDCPASIGYYVSALGFSKKWDWGSPPVFACVTRDNVDIFLCQGVQGQRGMWMSIFVEDVDALYDEYRAGQAIIRLPPTNLPWGSREMNVQDRDGHRIRFASDATGPADDAGMQAFSQMEQS